MNKFTTSILATMIFGASLSAMADDSMKGMDMSKMPMMEKASNGSQSMSADCMKGMSMGKMDMSKMSVKSSKSDKVACGVGVITSLDAKKDMIVLNHQAIKALNWPAMKMGFKVADHKLLDGLNVGQKVCFELKADGENEVVTGIMPTK
jgi:Cu(I)/Ag(I) efflux system protein CusF